jgi:hypothetical protein
MFNWAAPSIRDRCLEALKMYLEDGLIDACGVIDSDAEIPRECCRRRPEFTHTRVYAHKGV